MLADQVQERGPLPTKLETEGSLVMPTGSYRSYSWPSQQQYPPRPTRSFTDTIFRKRQSFFRVCVDVGVQACGTAGLVQTAAMFGYVFIYRGEFNDFEEAFLLTTVGFETAAEVFFLLAGISVYSAGQTKGFSRAMATNPVHHYARALLLGGSGERTTQYFTAANVAMFVALASLIPWALFCPVWGPPFAAESQDVMMALSTWSCAGVVMLVLSVVFSVPVYDFGRHSSDWSQVMFHSIISMVLYVSIKVFEVFVLLSDSPRLCAGAFGRTLVGLQLSEIVSITAFVAAILVGSPRCQPRANRRPSEEDDWLRANTMARPSEFFDASLFPDPSLFLSRESSLLSPA